MCWCMSYSGFKRGAIILATRTPRLLPENGLTSNKALGFEDIRGQDLSLKCFFVTAKVREDIAEFNGAYKTVMVFLEKAKYCKVILVGIYANRP